MKRIASLAAALLVASCAVDAAEASSYEFARQEQTCPKTGEPRAARQTILVLDEAIVQPVREANQRWVRMLVEAADARDASVGALGVRERVGLYVARRDGSELVPVFVGCSPNISAEELAKQKGEDTAFGRFAGRDAESRLKAARDAFADGLALAIGQIQRQSAEIGAEPAPPGALLRALQNAGQLAEAESGVPRFIIVSPFSFVPKAELRDVADARSRGFALAEKSGLDLGRAEIYLAGASFGDGPGVEFARAFLLGSKGFLAGARSDGLPRLAPEPASVRVYQGFVDYVGQRTPLQVRLSATAQGDLVNSWVEATVSKAVATPLGGKILCRKPDDCELRGDDRFARAWFDDPNNAPADLRKVPFGGARKIEMTIRGDVASGRIFDPNVRFVGEDKDRPTQADELKFEINRIDGLRF